MNHRVRVYIIIIASFFVCLTSHFSGNCPADGPVRSDILVSDFEGADYAGWTATGNAFGNAPASANEPGGMGQVFGHHGNKLVNTFVAPGTDLATGTLTSPEFTVERKKLVFHIGGGKFPGETGISLIIDGETILSETGLFSTPRQGHEGLEQRVWDVERFQGRKAQLVIFDRKEGGNWGHIKVDYIYQTDEVIVSPKNAFMIGKDVKPVEYNRMIFGQFIEHFHRQIYGGIFEPGSPLSDEKGFRLDVIDAMKELKVPIVRWPGGCFVSAYHWLDGVGPERQPAYDKAWHVEDPNTFGTAEFVEWCRRIGAEPYICTNAGTGTPEEMSDWVEYCNLKIGKYGRLRQKHGYAEPFAVKYWSIGNENYGGWEMGAKTSEEWRYFVRESAKLMISTDADIKLFAAALPNENWTRPLLEVAGNRLDYVSIHGYWGSGNVPYLACMMQTTSPENNIRGTIDILDKTGRRGKTKIAFDEWNLRGWYHPGHGGPRMSAEAIAERDKNDINSTYTMADALFTACFLNTCFRYCNDVEIACFSPIINTRGALFVHPKGIVKRTSFHVFQLYANELEKNILPVTLNSERLEFQGRTTPVLDAVLTCNDTKDQFALAVVNKDPEKEIGFLADFGALAVLPSGQIEAIVLSGNTPDDFNDIGSENRVVPVKRMLKIEDGRIAIPAHSLAIIKIKKD